MIFRILLLLPILIATPAFADSDWHHSRLSSDTPDGEVLRFDIDDDGEIDVLERWWNGKRVRWLDENGDLRPDDLRGDMLHDVLQIDHNGDGIYDGRSDMNVKWADLDENGVPDMQAIIHRPWDEPGSDAWHNGQWMIFRNFDDRGVLQWIDWTSFRAQSWGRTGKTNWLPNYHGDTLFLKVHSGVDLLNDPTLNWENPFIFEDLDDDGVLEVTMRWVDSYRLSEDETQLILHGLFDEAFVAYDLDNDSGKDNESDLDMTLRGAGGPGIDYRHMVHGIPGFVGDTKFDPFFQDNTWRRLDKLRYMPLEDSHDAFFSHDWAEMYFVFDEDDDDHRWERVELYFPDEGRTDDPRPIDLYSLERWGSDNGTPGLSGHPQADSLGDRGEFDMDNSGKGKLYIGVFDRKLHLYGAEWGAWTVDYLGEFHGGRAAPTTTPVAAKVEELVKYTDSDENGYLDTIEFDYDGDRTIDLRVSLLDYVTDDDPSPDVAELHNPHTLGWAGLHELFNQMAEDAWVEALAVYRAAWKRGLTNPELDLLSFAASKAERYAEAYWLKEKIFRHFSAHIADLREKRPDRAGELDDLLADLTRLYYLGHFEQYVERIADIPAK